MKYVNSNKKCFFTSEWVKYIDYKNVPMLLDFVDYFGKIKKSYYTGTSRKKQAELSRAVKRARHMGLLAFAR